MIRRLFLVACTMLVLGAAPAAAESYGDILSQGDRDVTVVDPADEPSADLARTGSSQTVPMAEAAIVLIGGGSMLLVVGRRRRLQRQKVTA